MVQVAKALAGTSAALSPRALIKLQAQVQAMVCCLNCPGGPWDVGVMLTTDSHVQKLNRKFRNKDNPTDILSFPFHKVRAPGRFRRVKSQEERYLGDIYISPAYVRRQCTDPELEEVTTLEERLPVLMAHGLCHLMGYDHERDDDYEHMQKAENSILERYLQFLPPAFAPDDISFYQGTSSSSDTLMK
ncbi:YbeY metalloprotein [Phytophthora megakarya]|uniref:YbeY metalloprotein n=1 Tax=Phytophthora megakarya TaxID=4795 RepID=A0A225VT61_9STRA|nr:YbeY metalloprotein [Phytophthora megakarya]